MKIYAKSRREFLQVSFELRITAIQSFQPIDFQLKSIRDSKEQLHMCKAMLNVLKRRLKEDNNSSSLSFLD